HRGTSGNFFRYQLQSRCRLSKKLGVKVVKVRYGSFRLFAVRNDPCYDLYQEPDQRRPDNGHHNVKGCMGIGDLSGDHHDLRSLWGDHLDKVCERPDEPDEKESTCYIEGTVGNGSSLGILGLSDAGKDCCDSRTDII